MPGIGSLFIIPGDEHKNTEPKPVYLNAVAANIVAQCRGDNNTYVFTYKGKHIRKVVRGAWHKACQRAELYDDSPKAMQRANGQAYYPIMHDLRKLACTRLDNLPMAIDTRQKIMGHTTGNITQDLYTFQYLEPIKKALDMLATCENKLTFLPIAK
jgi:integrase